MAVLTLTPEPKKQASSNPSKRKKKQRYKHKHPSSWDQIKNLLTCKQIQDSQIHDPSRHPNNLYSSCTSICTFRDVVHGNTRVVHRADNSPDTDATSLAQDARLLPKKTTTTATLGSSSSRSMNSTTSLRSSAAAASYTGRGMQLRKLSGCYECHAIVDPTRYPLPRTTVCACSECGEVFPKIESLEHHQAVRHAVSELGAEDSSRNIVEIIFKSSWLKKDNPICKIERILKVHNTKRTIQRFEDYRDAVKIRATNIPKRNARCAADGNELLRFHSATLTCSLGDRGSSSLCGSIPACGVCTIIRHGFQGNKINGIRTTASSGRAHDCLGCSGTRRAMLVCRVIAGRVKCSSGDHEDGAASPAGGSYDSVASYPGTYSNLEELYVFNARAILPCFVVIYKALES
ncbi:hypothetical protein Sango_2141500 [Sesamum angolense]|uniref:C2H2-type domain-containing protein n=1 Tax=Sesamum angolense TaxID=2727404 RepID=A0AAE2BMF6_9LAMI|nr:hypothetical protein Sango_2141500 [Sesamum angolense]